MMKCFDARTYFSMSAYLFTCYILDTYIFNRIYNMMYQCNVYIVHIGDIAYYIIFILFSVYICECYEYGIFSIVYILSV